MVKTIEEAKKSDCWVKPGKCTADQCMLWFQGYPKTEGECSFRRYLLGERG